MSRPYDGGLKRLLDIIGLPDYPEGTATLRRQVLDAQVANPVDIRHPLTYSKYLIIQELSIPKKRVQFQPDRAYRTF